MEFDARFKETFLTQGNSWGYWYNILLLNTPFEALSSIKSQLKNDPQKEIASCVVHISKPTLITLQHAIKVLESSKKIDSVNCDYVVYSAYLSNIVTKAFLESGCIQNNSFDLEPKTINENLESFASTNPKTIFGVIRNTSPLFMVLDDLSKKEELNFIVEDKLPKELQRQINDLIARRNLHIKYWTTEKVLSTFLASSGQFIEPTHDYLAVDVNTKLCSNNEKE